MGGVGVGQGRAGMVVCPVIGIVGCHVAAGDALGQRQRCRWEPSRIAVEAIVHNSGKPRPSWALPLLSEPLRYNQRGTARRPATRPERAGSASWTLSTCRRGTRSISLVATGSAAHGHLEDACQLDGEVLALRVATQTAVGFNTAAGSGSPRP
jgi:hypothetical protein